LHWIPEQRQSQLADKAAGDKAMPTPLLGTLSQREGPASFDAVALFHI
jgi:hypothetical protein